MQVTHTEDHVTSVTVSTEKAIEFGITSDASFFHILSSTLYKNQKLAVVRETLCNAWDIHIECGVTDKPVEVTVDNDKIIIKDHGRGIHKDDMGLIYGTYGNSTKKNDGQQTGGFGLGCKSPFAYTDHFDVQSSHNGIRTIYNLSKSSGKQGGKPTINPIVSVPTTDNGLQVTIPIKPEDKRYFIDLFHKIAGNGSMNVILNGEPVENSLEMDDAKGFVITTRRDLLDKQTKIMVRYGNVIYPVDRHEGYEYAFNQIHNHIDRLGRGHGQHYIVFQAKPHSIAVTPSREELSMQDHTVNSLAELFNDFMKQLTTNFDKEAYKQIEVIIKDAVHRGDTKALISNKEELPYGGKLLEERNKRKQLFDGGNLFVSDWGEQVDLYLLNHYPDFRGFHLKDIKLRLQEMIKANLGDRGLMQTYLKELNNNRRSNWLVRHVLSPLLKEIYKANLDTDKLFVHDPDNDRGAPRSWESSESIRLSRADEAGPLALIKSIGYLNKVVVLGSSNRMLKARLENDKDFQSVYADPASRYYTRTTLGNCWLYYKVSKKKGEREAITKIFKDKGYKVFDFIDFQPWESRYLSPGKAKPVKDIKPKGMPTFDNAFYDYATGITQRNHVNIKAPLRDKNPKRSEDIEAVANYSIRDGVIEKSISGLGSSRFITEFTAQYLGGKIGVCTSTAQYMKKITEGKKDIKVYAVEKVIEYLSNSKAIIAYEANSLERIKIYLGLEDKEVKICNLFWRNSYFTKKLGINDLRTKEDKDYLKVFNDIKAFMPLAEIVPTEKEALKALNTFKDTLDSIQPNPKLVQFVKHIRDSNWVNSLNISWLEEQFSTVREQPKKLEELDEFIQMIFNY